MQTGSVLGRRGGVLDVPWAVMGGFGGLCCGVAAGTGPDFTDGSPEIATQVSTPAWRVGSSAQQSCVPAPPLAAYFVFAM